MAPSPVLNIEPKGPDKTGEKCPESVSTNDKQNKSKTVDDNAASKDKISVDQLSFAEIEEAGLKSLLDEAYSYKSPKDRLGKSDLFQVLLNEVEENDASKKKLSERSNSFADGRGNASASIGNGHDTANDKTFLNNILGGCEKDKKKKKSKRESLGTNGGSRRPKFSHSMKVNTGPQSSSAHLYNGNNTNNNSSNNTSSSNSSSNNNNNNNNTSSSTTGSSNISSSSSNNNTNSNSNISSSSSSCSSANGVHYNGSSRSLSRTHQSFASRINNSKTAALLTSSSNIDIPMVTTYNKQPIMTPALLPSSQKSAELLMLDLREQNSTCSAKSDDATVSPKSSTLASGAETENDIEMKILDTKNGNSNSANNNNNDSVYNYTTHASLEIGAGNTDACKQFDDCSEDNDNAAAVIFPLQSSGSAAATAAATLLNGNAERSSMQRGNSQKPVNGLSADEKEEIDHVICNNNNNSVENDEDKHSKKKNKKKQAPCLENDNDNSNGTSIYATSIDEPKTMTSLLQKSAQNSSTNNSAYKYPTEPYSFTPWHVPAPNLIVTLSSESMANLGRNICTKDSLDSRRLYDENSVLNSNYPYLSSNSASMNRDRVDNVSERKHKIRKPKKQNTTSVLSENIEGYCGDKSVEYLVDYIENTKAGGGGGSCNGGGNGTGGAFGELGNSSTSKSVKSKSVSSSSSRNCDRSGKNGGKAATDDDVRSNKKPSRAKDRLKKSTSLEDLRHSSSKTKQQQNKKQSSVDDSHYIGKESSLIETESISPVVAPPAPVSNSTPIDSQTSSSDDTISHQQPPDHHREFENLQLLQEHQHQHQQQQQQNVDQQLEHSHNLYYDNLDHVDDDNYTETEFHLVTKKQRKKKRRSKSRSSTLEHQKHHNHLHHHSSSHHSHQHHGIHDASATASASSSSLSHNFLPHHYTDKNDNGNFAAYQNSKRSTRSSENRHRSRRKSVSSVVPSDKISDSDSIHSLPVSSTTPKCKIKKKSTSSGCTPQASYADIAKSPQCNSSTTLNGGDAKWHRSLKPFSNSPSSSLSSSSAYSTQNTCGSVTTASSFGSSSASSSSNTGGDSPEHSDNSELTCATTVPPSSSVVVGVDNDNDNDRSCDLNCSNVSSPAFNDSAATIVDAASSTNLLIDDKDSGCSSSVNDSGANESTVDVATSTPPRRKNKSSTRTKNTNDNNDTNNNATNVVVVCCNGNGNGDCDGGSDAIDTTKMPKDYPNNISNSNASNNNNVNNSSSNSNNNNNNNSNNTNNTKVKKTRNKKNKNANGGGGVNVNVHGSSAVEGGGGNVDENDIANDNHDAAAKTSTSNDLFVEFTLKCAANASATITTTKCSETQTDLETVEVNNNACTRYHHHHHLNHHNLSNSNGCNDVSVEETIVLKSSCSKSNDGTVSSDGSQSMSYVDKLSHSLPIHDETGRASVTHVLNDRRCPNSGAPDEINVAFNVDDNVLSMGADDAEAVEVSKQRQLEIQKEIIERSSKYNVTEVIQYVNKSWNEVMNLASSKVTNINKKVQYYASK
ncbi:uncharacterized protein DDB_G0283357-like isoform X3 [Planococcus citri]|uniref:uncharacterized protein DDB_G0283357-like isoform X3 n=1 Tax=Planococcus citri TaxID=170843 RepID=UPI0031F9756F